MNAVQTPPKPATPPNVPFGTYPRRAGWPLVALVVVYVLAFAALIWLTVRYPAG